MKTNGIQKQCKRKHPERAVNSRWKVPTKVTRRVGFGMIGIAAVASYFLTPIPVAIGLTILAASRIWIIVCEEKREVLAASISSSESVCPAR